MLWLVPAPGLVDIHDELVSVLAGKNLIGRLHDRVGQARLESAGLLVDQSRGALDPDDRIDECRHWAQARDREVLGGAQGLDPVERGRGDGFLAQRVAFDRVSVMRRCRFQYEKA